MTMSSGPNGPDDAQGMEPQNSRNTPEDQAATPVGAQPEAQPDEAVGRATGDGPGQAPDVQPETQPDEALGEAADEAALRALMQEAVSGLRGSPDALDHLRHAIPVRRQRRRQAMVGAAAVVLLAGMALPALLRASGAGHDADTTAASATSVHTAAPGEDGHTNAWGDRGSSGGHASQGPSDGPKAQHPTTGGTDGPTSTTTSPADTSPPVPECSSAQLGQGASNADAPDSGGRVYGWFRVANVSDTACTVPSGGGVQAVAKGAADPSRIQIVDHTPGDTAVDLPPAPTPGSVVLRPGENYEVAFAWVPAPDGPGGCPVTPTTPPTTPTPTETPTDADDPGTGGADSGTADNAVTTQLGTQLGEDTPDSPDPGSVVLNHTPAPGAPVVDGPVIQDACAGTVYTTSAIPDPSGTPQS